MLIDRDRVKKSFARYTDHYDAEDPKIKLKIDHTYRVASISDRIARSLGLSEDDIDLAWLIGMLHDIGRFEQLRRFGTFSDADSIDHAKFGVELLFEEQLLCSFLPDDAAALQTGKKDISVSSGMPASLEEKRDVSVSSGKIKDMPASSEEKRDVSVSSGKIKDMPASSEEKRDVSVSSGKIKDMPVSSEEKEDLSDLLKIKEDRSSVWMETGAMPTAEMTEKDIIRKAIWNHNEYRIEKGLDERTEQFCHIIRDADKIDILKVNYDIPLEDIYNVSAEEIINAEVSAEVMQAFLEHHAVLRKLKKTPIDHIVGHSALVFELVYPISYQIVQQQGYLQKILSYDSGNPKTKEQFEILRRDMESYLTDKFNNP